METKSTEKSVSTYAIASETEHSNYKVFSGFSSRHTIRRTQSFHDKPQESNHSIRTLRREFIHTVDITDSNSTAY